MPLKTPENPAEIEMIKNIALPSAPKEERKKNRIKQAGD